MNADEVLVGVRRTAGVCLVSALALGLGCRAKKLAEGAVTTGPMPANTVMLADMMRELSEKPGFIDGFLKQVQGVQKGGGAALLTPKLVDRLREQIVGKDWQGLDRFPGWTMREINPTVRGGGACGGQG